MHSCWISEFDFPHLNIQLASEGYGQWYPRGGEWSCLEDNLTSLVYISNLSIYRLGDVSYCSERRRMSVKAFGVERKRQERGLWDTLMGTPVIVPSRKRARCINLILAKNVFCVCLVCLLCVNQTHLASALSHWFPSFFPFPFSFRILLWYMVLTTLKSAHDERFWSSRITCTGCKRPCQGG